MLQLQKSPPCCSETTALPWLKSHYNLPCYSHTTTSHVTVTVQPLVLQPHSHEEAEMRTSVGLVKGHAYGITDLRKVNIGDTNLFTIFK